MASDPIWRRSDSVVVSDFFPKCSLHARVSHFFTQREIKGVCAGHGQGKKGGVYVPFVPFNTRILKTGSL